MKVAIVGAGIVGRLTALQLINVGVKVTLFEKHPLIAPVNAAHVSAGMLCPLGEIIHAPQSIIDMGMWGLSQWPKLLSLLKSLDPEHQSVFFQANGSLVVAFESDQQCFEQFRYDLKHKASAYADNIHWLSQDNLHALEPCLTNFKQASLIDLEAQLCNRSFLSSSARALTVHSEIFDDEELSVKKISSLSHSYDWVVDARGAMAVGKEHHSSKSNPLRGVRGEVIRIECPEVKLSRPIRVLHPRHPIYIVPKPNGEFVIGATEIESNSEHNITVRSTLELLNTLYSVNPAFSEARILEANIGIRAAYFDNEPRMSIKNNIIVANGLYRHGWLVGPALVEQVLTSILGTPNDHIH
ncbi:FAD-dependent oxidoreductase [Reinekea sp.]|jgi:glycine oxidase|uniref:FAD-dependent oxidoreductase n=1 Tax=Reinekea sp. TaxID=1970455 RepID=UPI00398A2704